MPREVKTFALGLSPGNAGGDDGNPDDESRTFRRLDDGHPGAVREQNEALVAGPGDRPRPVHWQRSHPHAPVEDADVAEEARREVRSARACLEVADDDPRAREEATRE